MHECFIILLFVDIFASDQIKIQCNGCLGTGHMKWECKDNKRTWKDYVKDLRDSGRFEDSMFGSWIEVEAPTTQSNQNNGQDLRNLLNNPRDLRRMLEAVLGREDDRQPQRNGDSGNYFKKKKKNCAGGISAKINLT